MAPEII